MARITALLPGRLLQTLSVSTLLLALALVTNAASDVPNPAPLVGSAKVTAPLTAPAPVTTGIKKNTKTTVAKPYWTELTPAQQYALAPLASEWDKLDGLRKKKWLEVGNKFVSMNPDERQRVQERMREWVKLTPDQRRVVRENYTRAKKINPDQKSAQWEQYQQLPEDQKIKLAADTAAKKQIANLPSSSQKKTNIVPFIKPAQKHPVKKEQPSKIVEPSAPPSPAPAQPSTEPAPK